MACLQQARRAGYGRALRPEEHVVVGIGPLGATTAQGRSAWAAPPQSIASSDRRSSGSG
jgi:hypothetical protein